MPEADSANPEATLVEANRQLTVCNGCRYCEGYCAVFPAIELCSDPSHGPGYSRGTVAYLANLCHDCQACYQACMYAPPHEFAIDIPSLLGQERTRSYERYAWPAPLARAFAHGPLSVAALTAGGVVLYAALAAVAGGRAADGAFYRVVPYALMAVPGLFVSGFVAAVLGVGLIRFWRDSSAAAVGSNRTVWRSVLGDVLTLRYQGGGGAGCFYPDAERPSRERRVLHQVVVAGFLLAFVSTVLAAIWQDLLGVPPPYPAWHPVVVTGSVGGAALILGTTRLLMLKTAARRLTSARERALDYAFLAALDLAAITGILLLALRATPAMPVLLIAHLGTLVALYLTAPYGKFVHAVYRLAALVRYESAGG